MRGVNLGEVWMADFGMAAKVRPALLLTGEPAVDCLGVGCFGERRVPASTSILAPYTARLWAG